MVPFEWCNLGLGQIVEICKCHFLFVFRMNSPHSSKILHRKKISPIPRLWTLLFLTLLHPCVLFKEYVLLKHESCVSSVCLLLPTGWKHQGNSWLQGRLLWGEARAALCWTQVVPGSVTPDPSPGQEKQVIRKKRMRKKEQQRETSMSWAQLQPWVWGTPSPSSP